jgi:hypothetical protein
MAEQATGVPVKRGNVPSPIIVHDRNELASALRQSERSVIIDTVELAARFQRLLYWRTAQKWFLPSAVTAFKEVSITKAISKDAKVEGSWHLKWKVGTFDGRIVLTPRHPGSAPS